MFYNCHKWTFPYFGLDLCDLDLDLNREQYSLPYIRLICPSHRLNSSITCILPIMQIWHFLALNFLTLTLNQGHVISTIYCPLPWTTISKKNKLHISPDTWVMVGNVKRYMFWWPLTLKMYPMTPESIGFVPDLYPTMVLNTNSLGLSMPAKSGRQTHRQTNKK